MADEIRNIADSIWCELYDGCGVDVADFYRDQLVAIADRVQRKIQGEGGEEK